MKLMFLVLNVTQMLFFSSVFVVFVSKYAELADELGGSDLLPLWLIYFLLLVAASSIWLFVHKRILIIFSNGLGCAISVITYLFSMTATFSDLFYAATFALCLANLINSGRDRRATKPKPVYDLTQLPRP